jgi:hypothetical protein
MTTQPAPATTIDSSIRVIHSRKETARGLTGPQDVPVSLDGYVAPLDGSTDWIAAGLSDDAVRWTVETVSNAGAHLMGAATYAVMAAHYPNAAGPLAKPMNEIPKVVFSNSLTSAHWDDTTIAAGDLAAVARGRRGPYRCRLRAENWPRRPAWGAPGCPGMAITLSL